MTAQPPTAHAHPPASAPSASTPALPVDESDELSGSVGPTGAGSNERIIDRIERADIMRIAVVGLVIGGFFAVYVNGVAEGWWRAWGEAL